MQMLVVTCRSQAWRLTMSISIEGLDKLYKKFDRVKATSTLVPPTQRAVLRIQRRMQKYPPQRPGSKY